MSIGAFAILFGLDYIATVPPTVMLVANTFGRHNVGVVYGWVFAAHQVGAAVAAFVAGVVREHVGDYAAAFYAAGAIAIVAGFAALMIGRMGRRGGMRHGGRLAGRRVTQTFRTLALIYPAANAKWGGRVLGRRSQRVMTREERDVLHAVLGRVPAAVSEWSEGNAALGPLDIVEVRRPLTSLSHVGGGRWWAGPRDVRQEIGELNADGRYDSIYVLWPSDGQVAHCGWGCTIGPSDAAGGAGFSSIPSDHWPTLLTDPDPEQGYVHEWLHQVEGLYRGLGVGEEDLPSLHDADLSSCRSPDVAPFGQPYNVYHDGGARTWQPWYRDWMTGQVRRPRGDGCFGLTPERWALRDRGAVGARLPVTYWLVAVVDRLRLPRDHRISRFGPDRHHPPMGPVPDRRRLDTTGGAGE